MNENRRKFVEVLKGMDNTVFNLCNDIQNMPGIGPGLEPGDLAKSVKMNLLQYSVFIICSDSVISEDEVELRELHRGNRGKSDRADGVRLWCVRLWEAVVSGSGDIQSFYNR